jgi:hypothetical protein
MARHCRRYSAAELIHVCFGLISPLKNRREVPAKSWAASELNAMTQEAFHFVRISSGMLATDSLTSHFAGQFVQFQRDGQPLFAGHLAIAFNLFLRRGRRCHKSFVSALTHNSYAMPKTNSITVSRLRLSESSITVNTSLSLSLFGSV